jgi:hypothetical protein
MKIHILLLKTLFCFQVEAAVSSSDPAYNILSIDGGGIRGIIPAVIIQEMEKYAYQYAVEEKKYTKAPFNASSKIVAMKDLFNMTAGTSTGSILATGLVYPLGDTQEPMYWGTDLLNIYMDKASTIFTGNDLPSTTKGLIYLVCILLCAEIFYLIGNRHYDNDDVKKSMAEFKTQLRSHLIKENKIKV